MKKTERAAPAFQFYPSDFMTGAPALMKPDETHVFVWLLCLDWDRGGFEFDEGALAHWCRLTRPRFRKAWAIVSKSFTERDGRLYNPRLERERRKQQAFRRHQSESGKAGAKRRWGKWKDGNPNSDPNGEPNGDPNTRKMALQTSVSKLEDSVESSNSREGVKAGALSGARAQQEAALEETNRRRRSRGEAPLSFEEAYGG